MMSVLADLANAAKDLGVVLTVITPPSYGVWRYVIRPKVYAPALAFYNRVETSLVSVANMEPIVSDMAAHIGPNGGKSLTDKVNQMVARVTLLVDDLPWPTFEASGTGHNTRVNHMFERAFGYSAADLIGNGWKTLLHPDDAHRYFEAWAAAVADVRMFSYPYPGAERLRFVSKDGHVMQVSVNATPYTTNDLTVWMGTVRINGVDVPGRLIR